MHLEYKGSLLSQWGECEIIDPTYNHLQGKYELLSIEGHRLVNASPKSIWIVND